MQRLCILLSLASLCLCQNLAEYIAGIKKSKVFLRHNDLYLPLNPVLLGKLIGNQRMLLVFQHTGDALSIDSTLEHLESSNFYLVDRRGLLKYDPELVREIEEEELKTGKEKALEAQLHRLAKLMGSVDGINNPQSQLILMPGFTAATTNCIPSIFWKSLTRDQFAELALKGGLTGILNRLHNLGLDDLAEGILWRRASPKSLLLATTDTGDAEQTSILQMPGTINLGELEAGIVERFGTRLVESMDIVTLVGSLDSKSLKVLVSLYAGFEKDESINDDSLVRAWERIFKNCPIFKLLPSNLLALRPNTFKALSKAEMTGPDRLSKLMAEVCALTFKDLPNGGTAHEIAQRYVKQLMQLEGDLSTLKFLATVKGQAVNIPSTFWDMGSFTDEHWKVVKELPNEIPYFALRFTGFLLGKIPVTQLPTNAPGLKKQTDWKSLIKTHKFSAILERKFLKENADYVGAPLLWFVNSDPATVKLPDELLMAINAHSGVESSIKTALMAHAYRQDGRRPWLAQEKSDNKQCPLEPIKKSSVYDKLSLRNLKIFLSAGKPDSVTYLLPDRNRLLNKSSSDELSLQQDILLEIIDHVLSDRYDPDDLEVLVGLVESNWLKLEADLLRKVMRKLVLIDATSVGRPSSGEFLHRIAMVIESKGEILLKEYELTLEEIHTKIPEIYSSALFPIKNEAGEILKLNVTETVEALIWNTPDTQAACASLIQIMSWEFPSQSWSEELLQAVRWAVMSSEKPALMAVNLMDRISPHQVGLIVTLAAILEELGIEAGEIQMPALGYASPLRIMLENEDNQAGIQSLVVQWDRLHDKSLFPLNPTSLLDRYFQLSNASDIRSLRSKFNMARMICNSYEIAFQLLNLSLQFGNISLTLIRQILLEEGSINAAAKKIKETIIDP